MGAQIAAHLANAGYPVSLLDVSPQAARDGLERARKLKPDPFFTPTPSAASAPAASTPISNGSPRPTGSSKRSSSTPT